MTTIDPNEGTRIWTKFVLMEGNTISRISDAPSSFRTSTGERPTDEWLVTDGYRGYIDNGAPSYNRYTQKVTKTPLANLKVGANNVVVQTYTVSNLNSTELAEVDDMIKLEINLERNTRIGQGCNVAIANVGTIVIKGSEEDARNISNLGQLANLYLSTNSNTSIIYRDDTNTVYTLTPSQMSELWKKCLAYVTSLYQASWIMKDMKPLPTDYSNDSYWPSRNV